MKTFQSIRDFLRRSAPASHLTSFLILHELSAVVPLPIVYYTLQNTGIQVPIPDAVLEESERRIEKVLKRYNWIDENDVPTGNELHVHQQRKATSASEIEPVAIATTSKTRMIVDMATSYAVVKVLMPARIALSLALTPWFARRAVVPIRDAFKRAFAKNVN